MAVKRKAVARVAPPPRAAAARGLGRHLEGWQPGALAVFLALAVALLVVPRAVEPVELPEPRVDARALARVDEIERERALSVRGRPLDADVRELGSAMRAYGRADGAGDADELQVARDQVITTFRRALAVGPDDVLRLRAVQLAQFVAAVRDWEATGVEREDLAELGGAFVQALRKSGWVDEERGRRRLALDAPALASLFKKRWNEVTGAVGPGFDLSLDEQRAFYRFLLRHPVAPSLLPLRADPTASELAERRAVSRAQTQQYRLKKVEELARLDPSFAAHLARGVVEYQRGRYALAAEHFRRHLEAAPDGPYTLRARNYLLAALEAARRE
jgi:tetratricopeptide (TPR) repeat protein